MKKLLLVTILTALSSISFAQTSNSSSGDPVLDNAMNTAKNQSGSFNSLASNPFSFCSAPKPSKHNPMRVVWDQICPDGNKQATAAPVPVPSATTTALPNTTNLQQQFNQTNSNTNSTTISTNINTPTSSTGMSNTDISTYNSNVR